MTTLELVVKHNPPLSVTRLPAQMLLPYDSLLHSGSGTQSLPILGFQTFADGKWI